MDRVVDRVVRVTTAASETEGVAAASLIESLMIRRPLGSIDPNSIRETELHTESRRRHSRGERESLHSSQHDRVRDAARQRAAATRRMETDEARAERCSSRCTTKSIATKESYRLSSTCGAPRNHTNVPPVDAHV